ncbi:3'-5' exonuclease [Roseibium aestuarii]|uniref:3'-5' exonuclease n=1 Tax=Roseibium aestuarii TaxID=2600299 RepID=A0ABW4JTH7_9HYPH|nr:3'-5' exonuclease [Roseibium aestuarii]
MSEDHDIRRSSLLRALGDNQAGLEREGANWTSGPSTGSMAHGQRDLPQGPFRFIALDVETANSDRSSICQVGIACVDETHRISTWSSYIDPCTSDWSCTWVHGITARTVRGAPDFPSVLALLDPLLYGHTIFQHSTFDRSAFSAACALHQLDAPAWQWQDSVKVARVAWPELKGNGGHGLASLKSHLGLDFRHHDGEEDARASAEIVVRAETLTGLHFSTLALGPQTPSRKRRLQSTD